MKQRITYLTTAIVITIIFVSCSSFGTTGPNVSIIDPEYTSPSDTNIAEAQRIINYIGSQNVLLAREVGKLPEIQDGIEQEDLNALSVILTVYQDDPQDFDAAFAEMYTVGKPEVRRYCSPLQAVYWLAEEGQLPYHDWLLEGYSLQRLLDSAWSDRRQIVSATELYRIIQGYRDSDYREAWLKDLPDVPLEEMIGYVFGDYQHAPEKFTNETRLYIHELLNNNSDDPRWSDFDAVTDRLNAPELIGRWMDGNFTYRRTFNPQSASTTFDRGIGDCKAYAIFSYYCLSKAGYDVSLYTMDPKSPRGHTICVYKENGVFFTMDNLKKGKSGPYFSKAEIRKSFGYPGKDSITESYSGIIARFKR